MDAAKLELLKLLISRCKSDPSLLSRPSLSFFRDYHKSLGAKIPAPADKTASQSAAKKASSSSSETAPDFMKAFQDPDIMATLTDPELQVFLQKYLMKNPKLAQLSTKMLGIGGVVPGGIDDSILMKDPEFRAMLKDPEIRAAAEDMRKNPGSGLKHEASNPKFAAFVRKMGLGRPDYNQIYKDPEVQAMLQNPEVMAELMAALKDVVKNNPKAAELDAKLSSREAGGPK